MSEPIQDPRTGKYFTRFRWEGKRVLLSYGTANKREAGELHRQAMSRLWRIESGLETLPAGQSLADYLLGRSSEPAGQTVAAAIERYRRERTEGSHAPSTVETEDLHLRHLARDLGRLRVASIVHADLVRYRDRRLGKVSPATVRKEISTWRVVWRWATRHGIATTPDPSAGLVLPRRPRPEPFRTLAEVERIATGDQDAIWDACVLDAGELSELLDVVDQRSPPWLRGAVYACGLAGVRRSEWIRSTVDDWDLSRGTLIVRERKRVRSSQGSTRTVAIHPRLEAVIRERIESHPGGSIMFCLRPGETITRDQAVHYWKETFKGTRFDRLRGYHVLRHSFASNLAAAGVRADLIDRWMGHQTREMRERYRHFFPQEERESIEKLDLGEK